MDRRTKVTFFPRLEDTLNVVRFFLLLLVGWLSGLRELRGDWLGILDEVVSMRASETDNETGRTWASYHCLNGVASIWMMAPLTSVFVRTSSLFEALYTFIHPNIKIVSRSCFLHHAHAQNRAKQ